MADKDSPQSFGTDPPSVADTVNILANAMRFQIPADECRLLAGEYPVGADEMLVVSRLYRKIEDQLVRQAFLDVLVAITTPS